MVNIQWYRTKDKIYESQRTEVYRGLQISDNQPVIFKTLKKRYPTNAEIARLKHEYNILSELDNPGVIRVLDMEAYANSPVIVMEDFGGQSLADLLKNQQPGLEKCLNLTIRITDILGKIHEQNIIHKDINPGNIIWNPKTNQLKIIDFGISTKLSRENLVIKNPNQLEGTLAYISPEQTGRMNRPLDYRTDFYSLGITFYRMFTGRLPFDSSEPLELVHFHLAKTPPAPHEIDGKIPVVLSKIIMKLLAKAAEDRYQSIHGLKTDLEKCLNQLKIGTCEDFEIGTEDISEKFQIPERLYGRENEITALMEVFDRICEGKKEMIFFSGSPGIGKSALINEIHKPIIGKRSYFCSGKYDRYKKNIPYSAIIQALQDLLKQLLSESEGKLVIWEKEILAAVGGNGQVIIDVIGEVELIIGKQPELQDLPPVESQNRFNLTFQNFVKALAKKEHPLVIFLDDLQWTDNASLELIQVLMEDNELGYFLFIGAYRDSEVDDKHMFRLMLEKMKKDGISWTDVKLFPLEEAYIGQLISDTLHCSAARTSGLSRLFLQKTGGNPFFLKEFLKTLYERGFIEFAHTLKEGGAGWTWNMSQIHHVDITDNIVKLMADKLRKLPVNTWNILKVACCVGTKSDLTTLASIYGKSESHTFEDLRTAIEERILISMENNLKFVHDRVWEAAYSLIDERERKELHYAIGKSFISGCPGNIPEGLIFNIADQWNHARELLSESEQCRLLELNFKAGQKAKISGAYDAAVNFFRQGMELLPGNPWESNYKFTLSYYTEWSESEYLARNFEKGEELSGMVLHKAVAVMDKIRVYSFRIAHYVSQGTPIKALELGREALKLFGISLPKKGSKLLIMKEFITSKLLLGKRKAKDLLGLHEMSDERKKSAMEIMLECTPAAVFSNPELVMILGLKMVNLSLRYGNSPVSSYAYGLYGFLLSAIFGAIEAGYEFGEIAVKLADKVGLNRVKPRVYFLFYAGISHVKKHFKESLEYLRKSCSICLEAGDFQYYGYTYGNYVHYSFFTGENLNSVKELGDRYIISMKNLKQQHNLMSNNIWSQAVLNLSGESEEKVSLKGGFNEEEEIPQLVKENNFQVLAYFYIAKTVLAYIFSEYAAAMEYAAISEKYLPSVLGLPFFQMFFYFFALVFAVQYPVVNKKDKKKYLKKLKWIQKKYRKWGEHNRYNYFHKYLLITAEINRITGRDVEETQKLYSEAIQLAKKNGIIYDEAIVCERTAYYYLSLGQEKIAALYMNEAHYCYMRWGATAKVKQLEEDYPKYLSMGIPVSAPSIGTISSTSTEAAGELLDVKSIIKASQTLSGEVQLASLLEKMMHILIENAGAQKSLLIENIDDRLLIQGEGTADGVSGILQRQPVEESENVPLSVINYVARSEKKLVFDNVSKNPNYSSDPYIQKHQPKSVVCFPIVRKEKLTAIIYLENNLVEGAFTPARLNVLNTLLSQIAISMENARIYRDLAELNKSLEQKVRERTLQLEEMDKAKSRFFANISHEFRTPLTLIMGPLEKKLSLCRDEQDIQEIRMMLRNSRRLLNLVNQLLELARLESGKMKLETSRQNIIPFVKNIVMCFESLATQDKVDLIFYKEEDDIPLFFDPEKLEKIVTNLLSNAFKYTPAGGTITVSVRRLAGNDRFSSGCVEISVRDTGTGIPRDQLPHIFDRFYRGEGGHEYKGKGAGIGLALTKELVDLHHGEIDVQSSCRDDHSRGSEFFLRLPMGEEHLQPEEIVEEAHELHELSRIKQKLLREVHEAPRRGEPIRDGIDHEDDVHSTTYTRNRHLPPLSEKSPPGGRRQDNKDEPGKQDEPVILVVEDNADVRTYIKGSLEPYFKVIEAADGKEGILRAKEIIPDLIVSDVMMPETDGYELCRTLKQDVLTSHVPIILLTARVSEESILQGLETGADDYITKPFSTDLLAVRVRNLIDLRRQLQLEQKNRMTFQPGEISVSPLDDEFYKKLQDTIETHLSDPDFSVEALCRVLDMSQATLYRKVHGLTGKSPTLFLRSFRMKRAAQLLQANAGSVSDVAVKVGFPDKSYFARCFKEQFHCLPSDIQPSGVSDAVEHDVVSHPETNENKQKLLRGVQGGSFLEKSPPGRRRQEIILLVEDSEDTRTYIRQSLESDYHVVEAVDGSEGIARAMEIIPDLVISDIMMPGMDGYELCRALKQDVRSCHIPIVLLTAKAAEESKIKGLELGADDYITKPFNTQILLARIKNLVQLRSHLQEKRNREMTLLPVKISEPEIDREFMKELNTVIEENLEDPDFNVEQLAKKLYMSSATLYRKVQALSGEIPSEYIRSFRLRRAAQLFKENFGSVTEVAFEVGFNSRTYFTKCFKEKFHQLPSVYMAIE